MTRVTKQEKIESVQRLREWLKPGDTVYSVLRNVSRSGMTRSIDFYKLVPDDGTGNPGRIWLSPSIAKACGYPFDERREAVKVQGCGMDMGFAVVYDLSHVLFGEGFECIGERCPSADHSNGDRNYGPHQHSDGGYALRHQWL